MSLRPPRMDTLLAHPDSEALRLRYGGPQVKRALSAAIEEARGPWREGGPVPEARTLVARAAVLLGERLASPLRRVINATGVVLHTNLGRAPLARPALRILEPLLSGYVDLEMDMEVRTRGHRDAGIETLVRSWLGTDRVVVVVNNNAAAVLLALNTLSSGKETLVSRGELVEIGGGFRVPEVMEASGARLREVGTTNRTRLGDYRRAVGRDAGLLLKVHPSNYRVVGFTQEVALGELVGLGRELGIPVAYDWGTGLAAPADAVGLPGEEDLRGALDAGPDVLTFSTDKLFGACQGGLVLIAPRWAGAFRANPLLRALRADKVSYALLGWALDAYARGRWRDIPALALLATHPRTLRSRASRLKRDVERILPGRFETEILELEGRAGGGTAPLSPLASPALAIRPSAGRVEALEAFLREGDPPILGVLSEGRLLLHARTLLPGDAAEILARLSAFGGTA